MNLNAHNIAVQTKKNKKQKTQQYNSLTVREKPELYHW